MDGGQAYPKWSGWKGVKEGSKALGDVVRSLNVTFYGGKIRRRPGRRIICTAAAGYSVSRIFEHVDAKGLRSTLAALVAGPDAVAGSTQMLLGTIDAGGAPFAAIEIPDMDGTASVYGFVSSVPYIGRTILSDPSGRLLDFDGARCRVLAAYQGTDAQDALAGTRAYLWATPNTQVLAAWRNRVVSVKGRTIGLSADAGDPTVPADAPAGGANVWPAPTNFDVATEEGDEIMGVALQGDRLVVATRRGVSLVTEDSVSPVPVVADQQNGCVAPRSVQAVGGGLVIYLSDGAICSFNGQKAAKISSDVDDSLAEVDWSRAYGAISVHVRRLHEYRLWLPLKGRTGNSLCLVFNYEENAWSVWSGWYTFGAAGMDTQPYDVTAAASVILPSGEEAILTGDSSGRIWREDVGDDDNGTVFPAYVALAPLEDGGGVETFRDWRVSADFDGSFLVGIALLHGNCLEQEIDRVVAGEALQSQTQTVRLLADDAGGTLPLLGAVAWNETLHTAEPRWKRIGFSGVSKSMQPLILLPGQSGGVVAPDPSAISEIEVALASAGGRRG